MKKYFYYLVIICIQFFLASLPVFADSAQPSQRWVCLQVDWCLDKVAFEQGKILPNPLCAPGADGKPAPNGHRVRLTAKNDAKPLPNNPTYIVECLATSNGQVCTTGIVAGDMKIYGKDNTAALNKTDDYQFQGMFKTDGITNEANPVKSLENGNINPVEWQSYSKGNARKFFALNFFDPAGGNDLAGLGAQQQGTFSFETQSNLKDCVSISWDPYGRVFDSRSLEPIPNGSVDLLKKRENGFFTRLTANEVIGGAIENPFITKENGYFSFVVPDGIYKLSVKHKDYVFPGNESNLNQNFIKAYDDIYPYQTGSEINQRGAIQHRDVPLDSKRQGISYPIKLIEYFYNLDKTTNKLLLEGLSSHPLTIIRFYSLKATGVAQTLTRYRLLKTIQADKYGKFKTEIDQSSFESTEVFGDIELEKLDLTKTTALRQHSIFAVEAAQPTMSVVRFNPILNSIKGYAYDGKKNILPNTTVGIYLSYANKPYYETKTDGKGYYEIPPERIPDSEYTIKYTPIIGIIQRATTSKFIAQNSSYLENNHVNLSTNKGGKTVSPTTTISTKSVEKNFVTKNGGAKLAERSSQNNVTFLIIVVILLLLIGTTGGLLCVYLIKRKNQTNT